MKGGETMQDVKTIVDQLESLAIKVEAMGALANWGLCSEPNNAIFDAIQIMATYIADELEKTAYQIGERGETESKQ